MNWLTGWKQCSMRGGAALLLTLLLIAILSMIALFANAEGEGYACAHAEGTDNGVVTVTVSGTDMNCVIDVRGEVTAPLMVEVVMSPKPFSAEWYNHQCRALGAFCGKGRDRSRE